MSRYDDISAKIASLEAARKLVRYEPRRVKAVRRLYLCEQAVKDVTEASSALAVMRLQGSVLAVFDHWTAGRRVWVDASGKPRLLKPLYPPDPKVWEMLVLEPGAQVRVFFVFAEPNTIVATHARTRNFLGKKNSANWLDAKAQCMRTWSELFDVPPFEGKTISDYVTENCDAFPI